MIDIRHEKMFKDNVFVIDHTIKNAFDYQNIIEYENYYESVLDKARKSKQYNNYIFYAATDGWCNLFNNFIEKNNIIGITGNFYANKKWKWFPHWLVVTDSIDPPKTTITVPKIRWNFWVRRPRPHRIELLKQIASNNIPNGEIVFPAQLKHWPSTKSLLQDDILYSKIKNKLKQPVDIENGENGAYIPSYDARQNRAFDVVTETMWFKEEGVFYSEKTFKPLRAGQIPFVLGQRHSIKNLNKFGFKTFDKWIDNSYDDTWDLNIKAKKIADELRRISLMTTDQFSELWYETYNDRLFNQQHENHKLDYWKDYLNKLF